MTLEEALEELKRGPGLESWEVASQPAATILQAAASGDLIPRTDAELAVAAAYQRAADRCEEHARHEVGREAAMLKSHAAYFRALADADALAEVQALRERVRSLSWMGEGYALVERRAEAAEAEVARHDERAARICEALLRKGVSPEKWPDYFRNRDAGDQLVARAALTPKGDTP